MTMTREEKLYSMTMNNLVEVATKLGIKIDKKGAKSKAVEKILAAESAKAEAVSAPEVVEPIMDLDNPVEPANALSADESLENAVVDPDSAYAGDGTPLAEVGKEIAKEAKAKAKKAKAEKKAKKSAEKKVTTPPADSSEIIDAVVSSSFDYKSARAGKDISIYAGKVKVALIYVGAKATTIYFNSEGLKKLLTENGFTVNESREKFAFFSKIDSTLLADALTLLKKEV